MLFTAYYRGQGLVPPGEPGAADVEVRLGEKTATLTAGYTYGAISLAPTSGSVAGGTYVTISGFGTSFDGNSVPTFDGVRRWALTRLRATHKT